MAVIEIKDVVNLEKPVIIRHINGTLYGSENQAHKFIIGGTKNGVAVSLSGGVTATFIRQTDGQSIILTGAMENGAATVTLAASCYAVPGRFELYVYVTANNSKTCVYACAGSVKNTTTGTYVDPGSVVPDVSDIVAEYARMQAAQLELAGVEGDILAINDALCLNYTLIANSFIDYRNGTQSTYQDSTFFTTNYIPVEAGRTLVLANYRLASYPADYAGFAFYDKNQNFISGYQYNVTNNPPLTQEIPLAAAYVRCSYFSNVNRPLFVCYAMYDLADLEDDVSGLKDEVNKSLCMDYTLVSDTFINYQDGAQYVIQNSAFYSTDWLEVEGGMKIIVANYRPAYQAPDLSGLAFYDINKIFISGIRYNETNNTIIVETIPQNAAYVRCTYCSDVGEPLFIRQSEYGPKDIALVGKRTIISSTPGAPYDDANTIPAGTVVTYLPHVYPSNIPVLANSYTHTNAVTIMTLNYNKDFFGGRVQLFVDKYNTWVRMADNESSYGDWIQLGDSIGYPINSSEKLVAPLNDADTIPAGTVVTYIGGLIKPLHYPNGVLDVSTCSTINYSRSAFGGKLQIVADSVNMWFRLATTELAFAPWVLLSSDGNLIQKESVFSLFQSVGVIGDSYASGALTLESYVGADHYQISWPQIVARKNGIDVVNFSKGGLTTRAWLGDDMGLSRLQSETAKDLYICALGINDNASLGPDYIGYESDIGTDRDTFFGNYGKIISAIMTKAPDAKIVLSTMAPSAPGDYVAEYNAAIETIAGHFSIPCMIQGEDPYFTSSLYMNNIRYNHPTASGYAHMADAFDRMLCKVMDSNPEYFKNYGLNKNGIIRTAPVTDVKIGGVSVVKNGVAEVTFVDDGEGNITIQ